MELPNLIQQNRVADLMGHPVFVPPMPWKQCEPSLPYSRDRGASRYKGKMRTPSIEYQPTNAFSKKTNNCNTKSEMKPNRSWWTKNLL